MRLINGREIADQIKSQIKKAVRGLDQIPSLEIIAVGESALTQIFLREKGKACREVGINFNVHRFPATVQPKEVANLIQALNSDRQTTGILVQLPFPRQSKLNLTLLDQIDPNKDVDCLTSLNFGRFATGNPLFLPPTAQAVNRILKTEKISVKGKKAVIVGAGRVAGLPIAVSLFQQGATVTVCHEFTQNLQESTLEANVLVSAVGKPGLIKGAMVKKGAIVIDVGISWAKNKIVGDVDLESLETIASIATPVPGGVGPIMVACLLSNVLQACQPKTD